MFRCFPGWTEIVTILLPHFAHPPLALLRFFPTTHPLFHDDDTLTTSTLFSALASWGPLCSTPLHKSLKTYIFSMGLPDDELQIFINMHSEYCISNKFSISKIFHEITFGYNVCKTAHGVITWAEQYCPGSSLLASSFSGHLVLPNSYLYAVEDCTTQNSSTRPSPFPILGQPAHISVEARPARL